MKKKILSVLLAATMLAATLAGCGGTADSGSAAPAVEEPATDTEAAAPAEPAADNSGEAAAEEPAAAAEGQVLNIYCWNDEFQRRITAHYPGYVDNGDGTGSIGDLQVVWTITPNENNAYQNRLDESLLNQANAAADEKIDIFLIEADYALKYVNSEYSMDVKALGLTDADLANQYQYTKDIVTDSAGVQKGTTWQGCPALFIYRRDIATEVFGTDDPTAIQAEVADWSAFSAAAAEVAAGGYKMLSGFDDAFRVFTNNVSGPWVQDGKIVVDDNLWAWVDQTKEFTDNGWNNKANLWSAESGAGAKSDGDVFGYFGPAWFIDFSLAGWTLDDSEAPAEVGNGTWGNWAATEGPQSFFWGGTWICAAAGTDNVSAIKDIMLKMTCDETVMTGIVQQDNDFVNNQPAMEAMAASGITNAFLGGQNVLEKFVAGVTAIDMSNIGPYDQGLNESFMTAMADYFNGVVDRETALQNFYDAAIVKYPELSY